MEAARERQKKGAGLDSHGEEMVKSGGLGRRKYMENSSKD